MPAWLIPALISAGATIGSSIIGRSGGGSTKLTPEAKESIYDIDKLFKPLFKAGKKDVRFGTKALRDVGDYWRTLLEGDRSELMGLLGPEISRISDQYDAAKRSITEFAPRGGGKANLLAQLPTMKARDVGQFMLEARPRAAEALERIGTTQTGLGGQLLGQAGQTEASILQALLGIGNLDLLRRGQNLQLYGDIGQSVGQILASIIDQQQGGKKTVRETK